MAQVEIHDITLVFTITGGRSGTKLLSELLRSTLDIDAAHEPAPRFNYVFRLFVDAPEAAIHWLRTEKVPAIISTMKSDTYVETSHLVCKGFIEPILELGLRPKFIILRRPAREVATSMYQIGCIPERTQSGRLVLLGPSDPSVLFVPDWESLSDYQLCYWYALEIERRQRYYERILPSRFGLKTFSIEMKSLLSWNQFQELCRFVTEDDCIFPRFDVYQEVIASIQNPRGGFTANGALRTIPSDLEAQEFQLAIKLSELN